MGKVNLVRHYSNGSTETYECDYTVTSGTLSITMPEKSGFEANYRVGSGLSQALSNGDDISKLYFYSDFDHDVLDTSLTGSYYGELLSRWNTRAASIDGTEDRY